MVACALTSASCSHACGRCVSWSVCYSNTHRKSTADGAYLHLGDGVCTPSGLVQHSFAVQHSFCQSLQRLHDVSNASVMNSFVCCYATPNNRHSPGTSQPPHPALPRVHASPCSCADLLPTSCSARLPRTCKQCDAVAVLIMSKERTLGCAWKSVNRTASVRGAACTENTDAQLSSSRTAAEFPYAEPRL